MESKNDAIWQRAKFLANHSEPGEFQSITLLILYDLGIPVRYSGFRYLKQVIPLAFQKPSQIFVKELLEEVGACYSPKVEYAAMETAIREAIRAAWRNRTDKKWKCYFPDQILQKRKQPSNGEFIAALVYFLEMWQGCCKEGSYER